MGENSKSNRWQNGNSEDAKESIYVKQYQNATEKHEKEEAISALYERFEPELRGFLMRLTQDRELAIDLTQETFRKVIRGLDDFRGQSRFRTWLYTIAKNTWKNYLEKKRPVSSDVEEDERVTEHEPDRIVQKNERIERVYEAIDQLPDTLREALVLVRFEGLKYREAANVLDINLSALKVRVYRAMETLKEELSS